MSNEQKKELKDCKPTGDITLRGGSSTRVLSKDNWQPLNNKSQSYNQIMGLMLDLLRRQPNLAPQYMQMPQPTLKTVIILLSLISKPDARLKGTEKLMDDLEEKLHLKSKYNQIHQGNQDFQSWLSCLQQ